MTKNSSFSCFMAVFMSYCPLFRGSRAIYSDLPTRYMLERYDQKLVVFVFCGRFHELLPHSLGVLGRFTVTFRPDTCWTDMTRNPSFSRFMAVFMSYCPYFYGSRAI